MVLHTVLVFRLEEVHRGPTCNTLSDRVVRRHCNSPDNTLRYVHVSGIKFGFFLGWCARACEQRTQHYTDRMRKRKRDKHTCSLFALIRPSTVTGRHVKSFSPLLT